MKTSFSFFVIVLLVVFVTNNEKVYSAAPTSKIIDNNTESVNQPFSQFYNIMDFDTVSFEGTVKAASSIPDPQKSDYPNCLYSLFVEIDSVLSDTPLSNSIPCEVIVNLPIFKDNTLIPENIFFPGDKIVCICAEHDTMPQAIQEIQISDDIQGYEYLSFFALTAKKIESFQTTGKKVFAKRTISILPIKSLPKDETLHGLRRARIQNEITHIENELKKHGGSFALWKEEYRPIKEKYEKMCKDGWEGWINDSYYSALNPETTYNTKEYIEGIMPYKRYLEKNNIDLIIIRVPSRDDFAARVLAADTFQENPAWIEHYYECLKNDIEIVDPMPEMWNQRFNYPLFYYYYSKKEFHPCEGFSFVAAQVLSDVLKRYNPITSNHQITLHNIVLPKKSDWPKGSSKYPPGSRLYIKNVLQDGTPLRDLKSNTGSPFLFLSNSFLKHPDKDLGASVPAYTAYFIQTVPDWMLREGSNNSILRLLVQDNSILSNRRAVIMGVSPTAHWKGFPKLPKYITDEAKSFSLEKTYTFFSPEIKIIDNEYFRFKESSTTKVVQIQKNPSNQFAIELTIPRIEGKTTCVIRFNFEDAFQIGISAIEFENNTIIDSTELAQVTSLQADLYIPSSFFSKKIKVRFHLFYPDRNNSIKNIELWYY